MDNDFPRFVITEEDFREFHRTHFPNAPTPTNLFAASFGMHAPAAQTAPDPATAGPTTTTKHENAEVADEAECSGEYEGYYEDEEDDGLGYYPDGVKRTLTDEDVAFFRRSELLQMLKDAKRRVSERRDQEDELEAREDREAQERELQERSDTQENCEQAEELEQSTEKESTPVLEQEAPLDTVTTNELYDVKPANVKLEATGLEAAESQAAELKSVAPDLTEINLASKLATDLVPKVPIVFEDDMIANGGKKRKRKAKDVEPRRTEDDGITYRRIARELDEQPNVSVELDY